jgi:hypothetical protein
MRYALNTVRSYNNTTQATFSFLDCASVAGVERLRLAPAILCSGSKYQRLLPLFYTLLVAVVVGVPTVSMAGLVFWRRSDKVLSAGADVDPVRERQLRKWEERFGVLRDAYKPQFWCVQARPLWKLTQSTLPFSGSASRCIWHGALQ